MYLPVLVIVLGMWSIEGQESEFTINSVKLSALPSTSLTNGDTLELKCVVMFAKTTDFVLNSTYTFYSDDKKIHTITSTEDKASYIISKVRVSNSGPYKCELSVANRIKTSDIVEINVTGLSSPLINVSKSEVSEGDDVTVKCEAPEESAAKVFTFFKIIGPNDEVKKKSNHQEVKFMIKEGEDLLQFKCQFHLTVIDQTSPISKGEHVTVVAPFSVPTIVVLPSLNFTEGRNMSVTCSVREGRTGLNDMKVTLQKDGHMIISSTTNTLSHFQVATVEDMGTYTCKVESKKTSKSSNIHINIEELFPRPKLILVKNSKNQYINEGDDIVLKCSVTGLTSDASNRLDYKFILNKAQVSTRRGGKLRMTAAEIYGGSYVCQVTISNITKISEPLNIEIYAPVKKPVLTHIMRSNKTVVLGDTLELTCKCESGTPPITYSLFRGNDLLEKKTMLDITDARFLVNSSKSDDLGQYKCQATNRNTQNTGKYSNIVNVTVIIPISNAELKLIPSSDVEEGSEVTLLCKVENGTLPIKFHFYKKKGIEILLHNVTETENRFTSFTLSAFSKQDDGTYICMASNRAHKEVRSKSEDARAVLASWKKGVIGTFVLLIILAAIAICAYLHMDKKKKGKDISTEKTRYSKPVTTKTEKLAVEMKGGDPYLGSVENDYEHHKLKTVEENAGNNQEKHEVEHTETHDSSPDTHPDTAENNVNRTEDDPEANNHS